MLDRRAIALTGEIDIFTAPKVCRPLDVIEGAATIDLTNVPLMAAAGLAELARVAKRVGFRTVTLVGARPEVRRVLAIAQFEQLFIIE